MTSPDSQPDADPLPPGDDSAAIPPEAQPDAATPAPEPAFKPKKRRWPLMVAAALVGCVLLVGAGVLVVSSMHPKGKQPATAASTQSKQRPTSKPAAQQGDDYGDQVPGNRTPNVVQAEAPALPAALPPETPAQQQPAESLTKPGALPGGGDVKPRAGVANTEVTELNVPQVTTVPTGTANGDEKTDEYGESGTGYEGAAGGMIRSGAPIEVVRSKDAKPEQYYHEVTPQALMRAKPTSAATPTPSKARDGRYAIAAEKAGATQTDGRLIPPPGVILGGVKSNDRTEPYAPSGRTIVCELVFAVDSLDKNSPIIALTSRDFTYNGQLIIPANSELFSHVGASYYESETVGRIVDSGTWRIVMPDQPGRPKGRELVVHGRALMRRELVTEPSGRARQWSVIEDGRPGFYGDAITTRDKAEITKTYLELLNGVVQKVGETQKDRETVSSQLGGSVTQDAPTMRNVGVDAVAGGIGGLLNAQTNRIAEQISKVGSYVRVKGGTKFYLLIEEPILPDDAQVGRGVVDQNKALR